MGLNHPLVKLTVRLSFTGWGQAFWILAVKVPLDFPGEFTKRGILQYWIKIIQLMADGPNEGSICIKPGSGTWPKETAN
jgi:hypothetical protein